MPAERLSSSRIAPDGYKALRSVESYIRQCGLPPRLIESVKMRASQINGCAYCLDMHSKDARALGETEQRLYLLNAWRDSPFYSERERAALEWTEAITLIAGHDVPDEVYERVSKQFSEEELANLTLAIATINSWNRLSIPFRILPGSYKSNLQPLKAGA